jgi:hypothetical protein
MAFRPRQATRTIDEPDRVRMDGTKKKDSDDASLDSLRARVAKVTAYEKYKEQLNELFDGKRELPQQLRDILATRPGAAEHGFEEADDKPAARANDDKKKGKGKKDASPVDSGRRRVSTSVDRRNELIAGLRRAVSPREAETAIDALRGEGFSIPLELELLSKALSHKDESVIAEALRGLETVVEGAQTKGANLLKGRLKNVALLASSSEVRELCASLQAKLAF